MTNSQHDLEVGKLYFEEGLPGFVDLRFFQLVQEEADSPFYALISLENQEISFWVVNPFLFFPDYEFDLPEQAKQALRLPDENPRLSVFAIVTVRETGQVTVNLKAPIIVNHENQMAKQVILHDEKYEIRQPLFTVPAVRQE